MEVVTHLSVVRFIIRLPTFGRMYEPNCKMIQIVLSKITDCVINEILTFDRMCDAKYKIIQIVPAKIPYDTNSCEGTERTKPDRCHHGGGKSSRKSGVNHP